MGVTGKPLGKPNSKDNMSSEKKSGWLGYIGDYTKQLYGQGTRTGVPLTMYPWIL